MAGILLLQAQGIPPHDLPIAAMCCQGRVSESLARTHFERALSGCRSSLGNDHPLALKSMVGLAGVAREAMDLYDAAISGCGRSDLDDEHPDVLACMSGRADVLADEGRVVPVL